MTTDKTRTGRRNKIAPPEYAWRVMMSGAASCFETTFKTFPAAMRWISKNKDTERYFNPDRKGRSMVDKPITTHISIHFDVDIPPNFRVGPIHQSCRPNDKEPFCFGLTKEVGNKYEHQIGFSAVSFEDAFSKCMEKFQEEKSLRYWGEK